MRTRATLLFGNVSVRPASTSIPPPREMVPEVHVSGAAIFTVPLPVSVCDSWVGTVIVTAPVAVVVPFMTSVPVPANVLVPVNVKLWALRTATDEPRGHCRDRRGVLE